MPTPVGAVTVIVPVATLQVGWVTLTVGAAGVAGCAFTVAAVIEEVQPALLLAVTLYVAVATPAKIPFVLL